MIFVDANIFMYAIGREHSLKRASREFFDRAVSDGTPLVTSAEVLQEFLHVYSSIGKFELIHDALSLVEAFEIEVWPLEMDDVMLAWKLREQHPSLSARDLCHLASCQRRRANELMTFDATLRSAAQSIL